SSSADYRAHTRGVLRSISRFHGVPIRYAGLEEKRDFARALGGCTDAAPQTIEFALFGSDSIERRSGANRNLLLLDTVDRLCFSADDDTACRVFHPPERDEGTLEVHYPASNVWDGHGRPCDFVWRLQGDLDAAVLAARVEPVDVLALHEQLLGRRVVDIEKEFSGHVVHRGRMPPRGTDPGARVMFTMTGLLGDIGLEERWHLVAATPEILDQLESERIHQVG